MPDFLTHAIFAQELLDNENFSLSSCCQRHSNLFRLGSQGPDLLFYLAYVSPFQNLTAIGSKLHALKIEQPLELLHSLDFNNTDYPFACAYLCGYAAHLCLDEAAHPYVEARAREIARIHDISENCAHVKFENQFEAKQFFEKTGKKPSEYLTRCDMPATAREKQIIAKITVMIAENFAETKLSETGIIHALDRLPKLYGLIFDNKNIAKNTLDFFKRLTKRDSSLRWHIKRSYSEEESVLCGEDYKKLCADYEKAKKDFLNLVS